ncbi:MAG: DUF1015 domain-containing protein [Planctomycetes bacterium]|nr:DUF1015 domain-containing protein [Planctomycetota bacterium]
MADVQAFRGFRYDLGRVGELSDVVAPPYDVIDPALQGVLYERSPFNVVRLILNKESPADTENDNRYTRSAQTLNGWLQDRILLQDSARSLYVYHQDFEVEGRRFTRKGFMARVRLERFGEGRIYPHEETLSGPKADRLKLFRATAMNLSQVFGMYPDAEGQVQAALEAAVGRALPLQATDHLGVTSKIWPVTDQHAVSSVAGLMGPKPIFIADGHHRYETALTYLDERRKAGEAKNPDAAVNFVLMMLVSMSDPGLVILPTHRLISGLGALRADQMRNMLGAHFDVETVGQGPDAAKSTWELIESDGGQDLLGFGTSADGVWQLARFKNPGLMTQLAVDHSLSWRGLAVAVLHKVVLEKLALETGSALPKCAYVHLLKEAADALENRNCEVAVLVPPATMSHVEQIAGNLEKMPPKSTYFYPKVLSGLVFHSLKC